MHTHTHTHINVNSPSLSPSPYPLLSPTSQLHKNGTVSKKEVSKLWRSLGLADDLLRHIMTVGCFGDQLDWIKFFALGCSYLGGVHMILCTHSCMHVAHTHTHNNIQTLSNDLWAPVILVTSAFSLADDQERHDPRAVHPELRQLV